MNENIKTGGKFHLTCFKDASRTEILWESDCKNKVTNQALDALNNIFLGGTAKLSNAWYLTLINTNATALATMTYAMPVYTESVAFTARQSCVFAASSSQSVTNAASVAVFTNTGTTETIYGIALVGANAAGVTTPGDKAAAGGVLFSYGLMSPSQPWQSGNIIQVTYAVASASTT